MVLTQKQQQVLDFISSFFASKGFAPSVREIAQALGKSAQAIQQHIESLRAKGFLQHQPQKSRANVPCPGLFISAEHITSVPLLGRVQAGLPVLAEENLEGTLPLPKEWARDERVFMLRVRGDSMVEAHIVQDDLALVRQQPNVENGELVVARVNGDEATLKRFYRRGDRVILKPENSAFPEMEFPAHQVEIIGKLVGVFRKYS
jgi:repressor LexA